MDAPFYHRQKSKWTLDPRCDCILREFHALKYSFSLIADKIRRATGVIFTRNALIGRARRIGLPHSTADKDKQAPRPHRKQPIGARGTNSALLQRINRRKPPTLVDDRSMAGEAAFIGKQFAELADNDCRWPQGDGPYIFCAKPQIEGSSYCGFHSRVASEGRPAPKPRAWIAARQS